MLTKRTAIPSLTGIRGVAALWVVIFHLTLNTAGTLLQAPGIAKFEVFSRGWAGVDMFFVLSGYILMHSHGDEFASLSRKALVRFARSRFMRVYPLSAVVLGLIGLLCLLDPKFWTALQAWSIVDNPVSAFLRTALLGTRWLPGHGDFNPPTWSLSAEIVGYAAFPGLAWLLIRTRKFAMLLGIAAAAFGTLITFQVATHSIAANDIYAPGALVRMACGFVAGAALAQARPATPDWIARYAGVISVGVTVAIILSLFSWRGSAAMPAEFGALIFLLSFQKGAIHHLLSSRPVLFLGRISFSLYLIHVQLLLLMEIHLLPQAIGSRPLGALLIVGYFTVTLLLSWLLYSLVERPFQHLGRSMAKHGSRQSANRLEYDVEPESIRL